MTFTRMRQRGWFALAMMIGIAGLAEAQNAIKLSADPNEKQDSNSFKADALVRPNVVDEYFVFVQNPIGDPKTLTVQLRDSNGRVILAQGKIELKANELKRVRLEKVAPPAPKEAAPKDTAPKEAVKAVPVVEPPPGVELKQVDKRFRFQLWLLDGDKVLDKETKSVIVDPNVGTEKLPIAIPKVAGKSAYNKHEIVVSVDANATFRGSPAVVELIVPPQDSLNSALRSGVYRRLVASGAKNVVLRADDLPFRGNDKKVRFHINVDGLPRAFVYEVDFAGNKKDQEIIAQSKAQISVLPAAADRFVTSKISEASKAVYSVKPSDNTPLRIEVDNAPDKAVVKLKIAPRGQGTTASADEIVLDPVYDERAFLDFQNEDGGIQIRYLMSDRIYQLDTRSLRGSFLVQAFLELNGKAVLESEAKKVVENDFHLVIDDTGPENGRFVQLPNRHIKGTLLTLTAEANEPETSIRQAVFFVGEPAPDGKLPDTTVKGSFVKKGVFTAKLQIPDKTGELVVGVQFINETGVTATETQKIELVDPPPPTGTITGTVELGGRGQPGVVVSLRDAEGKEKGSAVTENEDDNKPDTPKDQKKVNGKFRFDNVPPGTYRLVTAKPDSGVGTKGDARVQVKIGKIENVTITLARKP